MKYIANPVEVEAFKIAEVLHGNVAEGRYVRLENDTIVEATAEMLARMYPKVGDYWVIQADGYVYLNPKDVFERKYTPKAETVTA